MSYEASIFPRFFSSYEKRTDTNKDVNGKGTLERYHEIIGWDIDEHIKPLIDSLVENLLRPDVALERYIPFQESEFGFKEKSRNLYLSDAIPVRRRVLEIITRLHAIRGTGRCYEVLFGMLGLTIVITEHPAGFSFDSPVTFDDVNRRFDSKCPPCSDYTIELTGAGALTDEMIRAFRSIITFNEPINARLRQLYYNGSPVNLIPGDYNEDYDEDFLN